MNNSHFLIFLVKNQKYTSKDSKKLRKLANYSIFAPNSKPKKYKLEGKLYCSTCSHLCIYLNLVEKTA